MRNNIIALVLFCIGVFTPNVWAWPHSGTSHRSHMPRTHVHYYSP